MRFRKNLGFTHGTPYKNDLSYEPDFIVETVDAKYLCEIKIFSEIESDSVLAKQKAALKWSQNATEHAQKYGGKSWSYFYNPPS